MTNKNPDEWKTYDEFAYGIGTNRLPETDELNGQSFKLLFDDGRTLSLAFADNKAKWADNEGSGEDVAEVIEVAPDTYFIDIDFQDRPKDAETVILNVKSGRTLSIYDHVREKEEAGAEPQVAQIFRPGTVEGMIATGFVPEETRDLIGLRAHFTYSPNHTYEHTYLSSKRYAWQCLVGVQQGHGDVDLASTWKFEKDLYIFTFREFKIPVASTFFYNFKDRRSTGKFLGITGDGRIENSPAGAFIRKASVTFYEPGQEPI